MATREERTPQEHPGTERKIDTTRPTRGPVVPGPGRSLPENHPGGGDDQGFGPGTEQPTTPKTTED